MKITFKTLQSRNDKLYGNVAVIRDGVRIGTIGRMHSATTDVHYFSRDADVLRLDGAIAGGMRTMKAIVKLAAGETARPARHSKTGRIWAACDELRAQGEFALDETLAEMVEGVDARTMTTQRGRWHQEVVVIRPLVHHWQSIAKA